MTAPTCDGGRAIPLRGSQTPAHADGGRDDFEQHSVFIRVDHLADGETHFEPGGHDDSWWSGHATDEMAWLARHS